MYGGYSIRYFRAKLPEDERAEYDKYIGIEEDISAHSDPKGSITFALWLLAERSLPIDRDTVSHQSSVSSSS